MRPVPSVETFCTIMSMLLSAAATVGEDARGLAGLVGHADDRDLRFAAVVRDAGDEGLLHGKSSIEPVTMVPGLVEYDERTWIGMPDRRAYSTQRRCSTFAPQAASSSISS